MRKKLFFILFFFCLADSFFAASFMDENTLDKTIGLYDFSSSFESKITPKTDYYHIETKYFEIIYSEESLMTAHLLYQNADSYYDEIADKLKAKPHFRGKLPVMIVHNRQVTNAYYTVYPFSHIVVYDSPYLNNEISVFSDTVLSVFYHELTHAISLSIKSNVLSFFSNIFGDYLSFQGVYFPLSFVEGVTVSFESAGGEGRLNDANYMQYVSQARLDDVKLTWQQVSGAMDTYTRSNLGYIFGGAFSLYIQQKYGLEKYAELWKKAGGKSNAFFLQGLYKEVYNTKLQDDWNEFYNNIPVPDISNDNSSVFINKKGNISSLDYCGGKYIWIDSSKSGVFMYDENTKKTKKLFECNPQAVNFSNSVKFSSDGKYISFVSYFQKGIEIDYFTKIYSLEKKKFLKPSFDFMKDADIFSLSDGRNVLAGIVSKSQYSALKFYELDEEGKNLKELKSVSFPYGTELYSLESIGNGKIAYVLKEKNRNGKGFQRKIVFDDFEKGECVKISLESLNIQSVRDLNFIEEKDGIIRLVFSWNGYDSFSRYGEILFDKDSLNAAVRLQNSDFSGGVNFPCSVNDTLYYVSYHFDYKILRKAENVSFVETYLDSEVSDDLYEVVFYENNQLSSINTYILNDKEYLENIYIKKELEYSPIKNLKKGSITPNLLGIDVSDRSEFSLGYLTSDPSEIFLFFGDVNFAYKEKLLGNSFSFGSFLFPFRWSLSFQDNWNVQPNFSFNSLETALCFDVTFHLRDVNRYFYFGNKAIYTTDLKKNIVKNVTGIAFTDLHPTGLGYFDSEGFSIGVKSIVETGYDDGFVLDYDDSYCFLKLYSDRFLPFSNPKSFTLNMPFWIKGSYYPFSNKIGFESEAVVFSAEIQYHLWFIPLYIQRMTLKGGYNFDYFVEDNEYCDTIKASLNFDVAPLIGLLSTQSYRMKVDFSYDVKKEKSSWSIFGIFDF